MGKNREMCEERVEFSFWSDANDRDKHFFKIMAGDFRVRLTIPHNFVQHFSGTMPRTIKLEPRNGSTFDVQLSINDLGRLVLGSGWEEFVTVHGINMGDFLVFKYDGSSHLKVLIFDPSCCEKPSSVVIEKATHKSQRTDEPVGMANQHNDFPTISSSNEIKRSSAQWEWYSSEEGNNLNHISLSNSSDPSECATLSEDGQREQFIPRYIVPSGTYLRGTMKKKLKEKVRAIHSRIPLYVCVINKSNIYGRCRCMNLSRGYANAYLPFEEQVVLLLQCNAKKWQVRCVKVRERVRLWKGWKEFASDNKLQVGEICLFELLKGKEYTMNVHIIRKS